MAGDTLLEGTVDGGAAGQAGANGKREIAGRLIRWNEDRAQQAYADGWWVRETLADALARAAADEPDRVLVQQDDVRITAAGLQQRATVLAQAMLARMPTGSVVTFMLPNWHEAVEIYLATTLAGMVAHPVLPSLRDHDLGFMLDDAESRMIFIPRDIRGFDYAEMLSRVKDKLANSPEVVVLRGDAGGHTAYETLFDGVTAVDLPQVEPDAVRMIMYTSGTTGSPKGVMHTHNSLHALIRQLGRHWLAEKGDKFLVPSPISHIGGSIYAFEMPLLLGTTAVLMEKWDPAEGVAIMDAQGITHMAGATPFLDGLLNAARAADTHIPSLKVFICGGASVPPTLVREASAWLAKAAVSRVYGSTEVPVTTVGVQDRGDVNHAAETDGKPGIAQVRLSDVSEICMRGPQMMVGYHRGRDEEKAFDAEGFYRSGDQGQWIDSDYLVVTGRIKDIIIRNGENIAPKEVEDLLVQHPAIGEIAIVGLPDPKTGERACAVIVPAGAEQPDVPMLRAFLEDRGVAKFKIPEQVAIVASLLKNDAGKVLKHKIRDQLLAD